MTSLTAIGTPSSGCLRVRRAAGDGLVRGVGLGQRIRGVVADEGVELAVHALDLVEAGLRGFARRNFAPRQLGREFGNGQLIEHCRARRIVREAWRASAMV